MRISEIESQTETEKKGAFVTLLNMLKSKADSGSVVTQVSMKELNQLMNNLGYSINYAEVDSLVKSSDAVNNLIHTYDEESITLATASEVDRKDDEFEPGNQDTVKSMAKRATKRRT